MLRKIVFWISGLRTSPNKKSLYQSIIEVLGYIPRDFAVYELALHHKSYPLPYGSSDVYNNERLEFLGDAALGTIIADYLYLRYPLKDEGYLTKLRSKIVNRDVLNNIAIKMGLDKIIFARIAGGQGANYYGNALEAFIGAIFIDKGYDFTRIFVEKKIIAKFIDLESLRKTETNFKSKIIEWGQKHRKEIQFDCYEKCPSLKSSPIFISHLHVGEKIVGMGLGTSKKEAEQKAAEEALINVERGLYNISFES